MRTFDRVGVKIERIGDRVGIFLPLEYEGLEGFGARFEGATEDGRLVFLVRPELEAPVRATVDELWRGLRLLFSGIADVGASPPWREMDIVWTIEEAREEKAYGGVVPISAAEVLEHRRSYRARPADWEKLDVRKGIFGTMTKLCELASQRLGFKSSLFSIAFGDAVANSFCQVSCTYGTLDVICAIFSEEFSNVHDDRFWSLASGRSREAVAACHRKIRYLEDRPDAFDRERARVQQKWGFPLQSP